MAAAPGRELLAGISGAAGNPLFVTEMVGALAEEGLIETSDGQAEVAQVILPPTMRLTILRRLSFLPDDTLHALRAASILGSSFTINDLSVTMAASALELFQVLADAITGRVLEDDGDRLRFRHDLIRDALYQDLPATSAAGCTVRPGSGWPGGSAVFAGGRAPGRGAGPGDTEAISWLTRAAREAAARSPDVAADLIGRAAALMPAADPGRDELLAERAGSLMLAGQIPDALATCRQLLERHHDPGVDGPVRISLGHALLAQGQVRDALQELVRAGQSPALSHAERGAAQAWAASPACRSATSTARGPGRAGPLDGGLGRRSLTTSIAMSTAARIAESRGHLRRLSRSLRKPCASPTTAPASSDTASRYA